MNDIFIHPTSLVETHHIGHGTQIWAFAQILKGATIGAQCNIGDHCFIESDVKIADNVIIKHGNKIWSGVMLNNGRFVGPSQLTATRQHLSVTHAVQSGATYNNRQWLVTTRIHEGASIRAGATVLAGTQIGKFSIVGAGAVVTKDVPAYALVMGNPAHVQGWVCQCGHPLSFDSHLAHCAICNLHYAKDGKVIKLIAF